MATHWSKKKSKKEKKCDVAIGNILENTLMGTPWEFNGNTLMGTLWELNGNTLEQEESFKKKKKCDVAIGNILANTLMGTLCWELNGKNFIFLKIKNTGPS